MRSVIFFAKEYLRKSNETEQALSASSGTHLTPLEFGFLKGNRLILLRDLSFLLGVHATER